MAEATFAVILDDQMSGAASQASSSLQNLRASIQSETDELRGMQQAMRAMKADASASAAEIAALQAKIDASKASIAASTREYVNLGGTFEKVGASAGKGGDGIGGLLEVVDSSGSLTEMADRGKALISVLGSGGVYAAAALAAVAIIALTAAVVAGIASMASYALTASDAARSQTLLFEGITKNAFAAGKLSSAVSRVSAGVAISSDKVAGLAQDLAKAGLRGAEFENALKAASIAASVSGDSAAGEFVKAAEAAHKAGKSVDALSDKIKVKLGGVAAKQMLGFKVQMDKAKENLTNLFSGVKIDPFLEGLRDVTSLLDENSASGRALKIIVETMLNPLFSAIGALGPYAKNFFRGMVIGALLTTIAVLRLRNALKDAFGDDITTELDGMKIALYAGAAAAIVIAVGLVALTVALGILIVALGVAAVAVGIFMLPFIVGFGVVVVAILAVIAVFVLLGLAVKAAYDFVAGLDFGELGSNMMAGLVEGITSGASSVMNALKSLADGMKSTIESALDMHSPSRAFRAYGLNIDKGVEQGVDAGKDGVNRAVSGMVSLPASGGGKSASSSSSNVGPVYITIQAPTGEAEDIAQAVSRVVGDLLEGAAIHMGAPLPEPV